MNKVLHLEVCSGLCNRLRAFVSGICLAEDLQCNLLVYWPSSKPESAASFLDLYEPFYLPKNVAVTDRIIPVQKIKCFTKEQVESAFFYNFSIQSNARFHKTDKQRFAWHVRNLLPVKRIRRRINENLHYLPQNAIPVGVHIRRTDHKKSIQASPLSGFIKAMRQIPNGYFYLATDDAKVATKLMQIFPGRIHCHETLRSRNSVAGVEEAMVSLYTLASCSIILGCNGSSFSGYAAEIGGKKLHRIR